ncbi:unnamed protein product [Cylicocyclus nassatus]|uniref:Uncharacterized protein n=1 Tax=Cylicocyclus nassatus TaxID=53992 RepID=A0AA36M2T3_CYLNA|nr:unnamed protein product [Cylicocyclus nassatus]
MESTMFCVLFLDAVFHVKISVWSTDVWSDDEVINDTAIYRYQTARFVVSYPFRIEWRDCIPLPNVSFSSRNEPYIPGTKAWSLEDNGVYAIVNLTQTPRYLNAEFWVQDILDDAWSYLEENKPLVQFARNI